jgi:molybdopterin/thiamine biosynthesis adenylyltransferase
VLPDGHPLRAATGGDARGWLALALLLAAGLLYREGLRRLRRLRRPEPEAASAGPFRPAELTRYARHIALREIGGAGQRRLKAARVLVVGAGGLGSPALLYLAAAGVGTIGVIDGDEVEDSNLQRQIIHADQRLGMPKVFSAEAAMTALNPFVTVRPYHRRLEAGIARALIADYDLVLDGSDSFATRELVNATCVALGKPLISAAITQWEGQIGLYHPPHGPCLACVFPARPAPGQVPTCAEAGVAAPLPGVVGAMMAVEAVKHLTGAGETLRGRVMLYDALYGEVRVIAAGRDPGCRVCGAGA